MTKRNGLDQLPEGTETRAWAEFRVRRDDDTGGAVTIEGHAATFEDPYPIADFEEQIAQGAFTDALQDDVRALLNHNPDYPLGRTKAGTLRLAEDDVGLFSEIDLPESRQDVREAVERGDIDQMSFAFSVEKETWEERDDKPDLRTIEKVRLFDVGPVTFPANPKTDVAVQRHREWRSARAVEEETDEATTTEYVLVMDEEAEEERAEEPETEPEDDTLAALERARRKNKIAEAAL